MIKKYRKINVPGNKSITHRAVIIASIARGKTLIRNPLICDDTLATINAVRSLGIQVEMQKNKLTVKGKGLSGLKKPDKVIDCGNSATTMRLMMGLLAGQDFDSDLTGDESLMKRPMERVIDPLTKMGASVSREGNIYHIAGRKLHSIQYDMPVSSAQIKSAIILADLYAGKNSVINDPGTSRNHTELMLSYFGKTLKGRKITVPGDISSAAYHIAKTLITPDSGIRVGSVGINETRTGFLDVIQEMGAQIEIKNKRFFGPEPVADIYVYYSPLRGVRIDGNIIPRVIDEIPLIAVLSALAGGSTEIRDASELRVKESDRIHCMALNLDAIGADVVEKADGLNIAGSSPDTLKGVEIDTFGDHRIAMSFLILADIIPGLKVKNKECVAVSYPTFLKDFYI